MASPVGNGRHHPITVANDQYGYVLAGQAGFASLNLDDVHRYDPATDTWETLGVFPGGGRGYGYGVCEGDDAFVGFGSNANGYPTDFWHLDMATGEWSERVSSRPRPHHPALIPTAGQVFVGLGSNDDGKPRRLVGLRHRLGQRGRSWRRSNGATAITLLYFGIDGIAYVGMGHGDSQNGNLTIYGDFHAYDPATGEWTQLNDFPGGSAGGGHPVCRRWQGVCAERGRRRPRSARLRGASGATIREQRTAGPGARSASRRSALGPRQLCVGGAPRLPDRRPRRFRRR